MTDTIKCEKKVEIIFNIIKENTCNLLEYELPLR